VEPNVVGSVEMPVESDRPPPSHTAASVEIRMLGPLTLVRNGAALALPASRKVRGLLTYLALAPHPVPRTQLCELLWDVPNDPRGELRWCLSKIRGLIDDPGRRRVDTHADTVGLDLSDCFVDAIEVMRTAARIGTAAPDRLHAVAALFTGDFLEGRDVDRSPLFSGWLGAQRRRFRNWHTAILERLVSTATDTEVLGLLERWVELAPFDPNVHQRLLATLARRGQIREGEAHLEATRRLFESEGIDFAPVRDSWRSARTRTAGTTAPVTVVPPDPGTQPDIQPVASRRASIAVMPFVDLALLGDARGGAGDALAHDVITRLAKLRNLFVIAQGTVFALHEQHVSPTEAARMLDVGYIVSGTVRQQPKRLIVTVEMAEAPAARIVWAETFDHRLDDTFLVLDEIGNRIVASIASEIEANERNRAVLRPPSSLDAWAAHHRALWHMYRFNQADNRQAQHLFELAVRLDPTFARAHAGLSFTHFQNVFQDWAPRGPEIDRAFAAAGQSLMADDRDPASHWAMGRALWLRGEHDLSIRELEHTVDLSPSFALGHYTLAFVQSQAGDPAAAVAAADHARRLSPFDPLLFGMMGARAMALVRMGRFDEAAEWGVKAAARPNAHAHIQAIAAFSLALAGRLEEAHAHLASIHRTLPGYRVDDLLKAMQFTPEAAELFRESARRAGIG
jgi:DNA-binding SARP family transcriptional activator/TolB-like protein